LELWFIGIIVFSNENNERWDFIDIVVYRRWYDG